MINKIQNQEHIEAHQNEINRQRDVFVASLKEEDRLKFKAVSDALEILSNAKVPVLMFPILPDPSFMETGMSIQYNNLNNFVKYDEFGKFTKTAEENIYTFNTLSFCGIFYYLRTFMFGHEEFSWEAFNDILKKVIDGRKDCKPIISD